MSQKFDNTQRLKALYLAIGYFRRRAGLTQDELAEELGISRQHLAAIESPNMERGLSLEVLFNIATVLRVEPYQLLKFGLEENL
ncbi:helix-turn-helix domain-containing protein [Acutalibacter intestini]|uniref:helix-turn-helix domain-containing protein n=1 Tax=Acutalibacter intestini TaxID=3093659 RepID=UPI002AC9B5BF|nr:helix-turn-helix transcriptional regulator [Acutalibacter sp. M00204]